MLMGINESRENGFSLEVKHGGVRPGQCVEFVTVTNGGNATV
jgi:hypothetical protein